MTKAQRREYKAANARRRDEILKRSYRKPKGKNDLVYLGGIGQAGRHSVTRAIAAGASL